MADDPTLPQDSQTEETTGLWNEAALASEGGQKQGGEAAKPEAQEPAKEPAKEAQPAPPQEEPEPEPEEEGEEDSEDEEVDGAALEADPWSSVPEDLRGEYESLKSKAEKYEHETRSNRGRLAALQRKYDELSHKLAETPAKDEKAGPTVDTVDSIFDAPDWKKFEEDFGADVAGPQKAAMRRLFETMHSRIQQIETQAQSLLEAKATEGLGEEISRLEKSHPGWRDYVKENIDDVTLFISEDADARKIWDENQDTLKSPNGVRNFMTLFKAWKAENNPEVKATEKPAPSPKSGNGATATQKPRPLTPTRERQLVSAAAPVPRSAPSQGSRPNGLPDPDDREASFAFWSSQPARP